MLIRRSRFLMSVTLGRFATPTHAQTALSACKPRTAVFHPTRRFASGPRNAGVAPDYGGDGATRFNP
jgi:hypothetical protein